MEIVEPCPPVYITYEDPETGHSLRLYQRSDTLAAVLTDEELDAIISQILCIFPSFGRRMINGHLRHLGHNVSRERVRESFRRVTGASARLLAPPIERRVYSVAGPNSLWHHDGQHGEHHLLHDYGPHWTELQV